MKKVLRFMFGLGLATLTVQAVTLMSTARSVADSPAATSDSSVTGDSVIDMTSYIVNAGFDEDITWQSDGSTKDIVNNDVSISNRSQAWMTADSTVYAHAKTIEEGNSSWKRTDGVLNAWNGFLGRITGWKAWYSGDILRPEWVYFGSIAYGLDSTAIPIADDGKTYLEVPAKPEEFDTEENKGVLYLRAGWGAGATYEQTIELPGARYRLEYYINNLNFSATDGSGLENLCEVVCGQTRYKDSSGINAHGWEKHAIEFIATSESTIRLGFKSGNYGSGRNPMLFIDGLKLYQIGEVDDLEKSVNVYNDTKANYPYTCANLLNSDISKWQSSDYAVLTANEHWNGQSGQSYYEQTVADWSKDSWTHKATESLYLPKGKYMMSITARASTNVLSTMSVQVGSNDPESVTLSAKGAIGKGVDIYGNAACSASTDYANNGEGFGWEYRFVEFEVPDINTPINITLESSTNALHQWVSIANPQLFSQRSTMIEDYMEDWTSTNHTDGSSDEHVWTFNTNKPNTQLSFDWMVSSESGCDCLSVYLDENQLLNESGEKSGMFSYNVPNAGDHVLRAVYSKDGSVTNGSDQATISNINCGAIDFVSFLNNAINIKTALEGFDNIQATLSSSIDAMRAVIDDSLDVDAITQEMECIDSLCVKANEIKSKFHLLKDAIDANKELYTVTSNEELGAALADAQIIIDSKSTLTMESLEGIEDADRAISQALNGMNLFGTKIWNFNISQETKDGLYNDYNSWGYWSRSNDYYYTYSNDWNQYQLGYHGADGQIHIVPETEGLFFIGGNVLYVYTDGTNRIKTDGSGTSYAFKIPNLTQGQVVTINYTTTSNGSTCGITQYSGNTQLIAGADRTTGTAEASYKVTSDGDVSFYPYSRSIYINSISVTIPNDPLRLAELRKEVADFVATLDSFPGLKSELRAVYDNAVMTGEDTNIDSLISNLTYIYNNVKEAVRIYPVLCADINSATAVLTEEAYVDLSEALALGKAIDVNTSTSAEYFAAFDALETALAIYNADQVDMGNWAFNTSNVYTVNGLRYYLDTTNNLAEFINFNSSNAYSGALNIPATIRYNDVTYAVVAMINNSRYTQGNITSVTLPKSLRYIGDYGLGYFSNVLSIEIPENVTSMGSYIFSNSNSLTSIKMNAMVPPTVSSFSGSSYKKITIPEESFHAYRIANVWKDNVLIGGDGVSVSTGKIVAGELGRIVIDEAGYLQEVNKLLIDEGTLNNDDWNTIKQMTNLVEIDMLGVTMASLPANAFDGRWAIEKVVLPHNLTTIGNYAFRDAGIQEINFPESLTTLGQYSFRNCDYLSRVVIPEAVRSIPTYCFYDCDNLLTVEMPAALKTISTYAFCECNRLREAALPTGLTSIGSYAFRYCPLKNIDIPSGITSISDYAFANTALESLVIPETVVTINSDAFYNCTSLKNVQFKEGLTNIYSRAFQNCTALKEIVLPSSLERCEEAPFYGCSGIKKIEARSVIPPTTGGSCPLSNVNLNDVVLTVPSWSTTEYPLSEGWSSFYTVEASDFMPQYIKVNKDFYFTLRDTLAADYRPNIKLAFSDVQSTDAYGNYNYERGNLTISGRSKLAVNNLELEYSAYAKYYSDENLNYNYNYDNYRTNINSTSLIVNGEMRAEDVTIWLQTYNGRWQFVSFPFDVKVSDIVPGSDQISWVIRKHNAKERAAGNTNSVWQNMNTVRPNVDVTPNFSPVATDGQTIQYLYNIETGTFLVAGNDWGTRASVSLDNAYQIKTLLNGDGTYRLSDLMNSKWQGIDCFPDTHSSWMDGTGRDGDGEWKFTLVGENTYEITNKQAGDLKWGVDPTLTDTRINFAESGLASTWAFVSEDDYMQYQKEVSYEIVTDTLYAGKGYIMHTYRPNGNNSWFAVKPIKNTVNRQLIFASDDRIIPLEENLAEFDHNRSWNLIGNPYPCFYDTRFMDFDAPFMVWNSYTQNYVAYNPADDAYILSPGEAFFVQRPYDQEDITFRKEGRQTHRYAREMEVGVNARRNNALTEKANRTICNFTISQGEMSDRTRVVFNEDANMAYEMSRDAAKFASSESMVPQIFTVSGNTRYSINERPFDNGAVKLGVYCGSAGVYTIALANELNSKVVIEDKLNNTFTEINGDTPYQFSAEAGEYLDRFVIHFSAEVTGIAIADAESLDINDEIYTIQGVKINSIDAAGIYIVNGKKTFVK